VRFLNNNIYAEIQQLIMETYLK